jgi:hypothetical protein
MFCKAIHIMLEVKTILLSETEANVDGAEGVYAIIRNDLARDPHDGIEFGKEYGYEMFGAQLHGPLPEGVKGGFASAKSAEDAARLEYTEWRKGNIPAGVLMARHVVWRTRYRRDRYMENLSAEELVERHNDILSNIVEMTAERKIGIVMRDEHIDYWSEVLTQVYEEFVLRGYKPPQPFEEYFQKHPPQIPDLDYPGIEAAEDRWNEMNLAPGTFLVKLGKRQYLEPFLESGQVRIAPASFYADESLNRAINDDELSLSIYRRRGQGSTDAIGQSPDQLNSAIAEVGPVVHRLQAPTNYLVYCMAGEYDRRLFSDFGADCCIVVREPQKFIRNMLEAMRKVLGGWQSFGAPVTYVDPMNASLGQLNIFFSKHFKYAYQKEYRLIWLPPEPLKQIDPLNIAIGPLDQWCELISLDM